MERSLRCRVVRGDALWGVRDHAGAESGEAKQSRLLRHGLALSWTSQHRATQLSKTPSDMGVNGGVQVAWLQG